MASRRNYVNKTEVDALTGNATGSTDNQISEAEELIDAYVGFQDMFIDDFIEGKVSASGSTSFTLQSDQQNVFEIDYFKWCEVEILAGTGVGERKTITASTKAGVLTIASAWSATPDTTSVYKIYQLGKFPRVQDVYYYSTTSPYSYNKQIPEAIKRATAFQVEYMIALGEAFFKTDQAEKKSESIGDYSYTNADTSAGAGRLMAPKAKLALRGIKNRLGRIVL